MTTTAAATAAAAPPAPPAAGPTREERVEISDDAFITKYIIISNKHQPTL